MDLVDGTLHPIDVSITDTVGTVTFEILEHGRLFIPGQHLDFARSTDRWVVTGESFCQLAMSLEVPCIP